MQVRLLQWINRLETLSARERAMALIGAPLVLVMAGELLVFGPARSQAADAQKQADRQQTEVKSLSAALAALPVAASRHMTAVALASANTVDLMVDSLRLIELD